MIPLGQRHRLSIGFVLGCITPNAGGLFYSVRRLAQEMHKLGHAVSIYSFEEAGSRDALADWSPLRPRLFPKFGRGSAVMAPGLTKALLSAHHDVVHQHGIWLPTSAAVLKWGQRTNRPTVISPRGMLDPWALGRSRWKKRLATLAYERANIRNAAALHALNEAEKDAISAAYPDCPVWVLPNGVDPAPHALRPGQHKMKTLLFMGRIDPKKGIEELIQAWPTIARDNPDWQLAIAGTGPADYAAKLLRTSERMARVTWLGDLRGAEKAKALAESGAFVLPSHSEGQPMAVLEAWAAGVPVFMSSACNLSEAFASREAIEVRPDPALLAQSISSGLKRPDLEEIGLRGQARAQRDHAWPVLARRFEALYADLADRHAPTLRRKVVR